MTKQNFISADFRSAITSHGEELTIGDTISHQDKEVGTAIIIGFTLDIQRNEIIVFTQKGFAHIDFVHKVII